MKKAASAALPLVCFLAVFCAAQAHAQSYAPNPVVYSPDQYPTAQGRYLSLPPSYQKVQPVAASQIEPPSPQPQYYAAPQPQTAPVYTSQANQYQQPAYYPTYQPTPAPVMHPAAPSSAQALEQLPSYTYDRNLDPRYLPKPAVPDLPGGNKINIGTETGGEFGVQISSYRYQEHDVPGSTFALETGPKFGLTLDGNKSYRSGFFISGNIRAAYGENDYTGSGTESGLPDWLFEMRGLLGGDFIFENAFWHTVSFDLSPYIGLGFRYLYNDARGTTSTGAPGYERYSHYLYLPAGLTERFRVTESTRMSLNFEYDQLLYGWQVSSLGDATPGDTDLTNNQNGGYGLRGSLMYEWKSWALGPFFDYWNINQSDTSCSNLSCGDEPHSRTIEYGFQGRYRF